MRDLILAASIAAGVLALIWLVRVLAKRQLLNAHQTRTDVDDFLLDVTHRTKLWLLLLPAIFLGARVLDIPADFRRVLRVAATLSFIAQAALWSTGVIDFWLRRYRRTRIESDPAAVMTVNLFRVAGIITVWLIAATVALANLNVEVTPLIASLGIGGVAVALALQNILGDLFASLSIVIDKPFILGDSISVDDHAGTVEHIGLKTTRVRAVSGEQLVFSNGDLLKSRIRNFKRMTERRSLTKLNVDHGTPPDTLARIPALLRAAVEKQKDARFDHAHLTAITDTGFGFELVYFLPSGADTPFLDVQQAVYLDLLRAFAAENIELAHPSERVVLPFPPLPPIAGKESS
jgi:small-conductance mechanosensitive channel